MEKLFINHVIHNMYYIYLIIFYNINSYYNYSYYNYSYYDYLSSLLIILYTISISFFNNFCSSTLDDIPLSNM